MPLSPTDFYAYSRATGAPVAETSEERARQAPDVYAFRQSQLQAPQQADQGGFNVLDALGKTALAAGALAGGLGLYGRFRGKGLGKAVEGAAESQAAARAAQAAKNTAQVRETVQKAVNTGYGGAEYAALFNENGFPIDLKITGPTASPQRAVAQAATEAKPNLGVQVTNLNKPVSVVTEKPLDPWQNGLPTKPMTTSAPVQRTVAALSPAAKQTSALPLANEFLYSQIGKILGDAPNEDIVAISKLRPFSQSQVTASSGLDAGDRFIEEYAPEYEKLVRGQARQDADVARRVRAHQMQVQGKAEQILADLKQETLAESKPTSQAFLKTTTQPSEELVDRLVQEHEQGTAENIAGQLAGETLVEQHNVQSPQHAYQSISAINSAEDQETGRSVRALQQDPHVDMGQVNAKPRATMQGPLMASDLNYVNLKHSGMHPFEIEARMQAYANSGDLRLLHPHFNVDSVGAPEFSKALGVVNAQIATGPEGRTQLVAGDLLNPQGETARSFRGSKGTTISTKDNDYDPMAEMFGVEGGVEVTQAGEESLKGGASAASDPQGFAARQLAAVQNQQARRVTQQKQGEQFEKAIDDFGTRWDDLHRLQESGEEHTGIHFPRRTVRPIDAYDLDIPTRIQADENGNLYPTRFFRDSLDPEIVAKVEAGQNIEVEVPYLVNKERAYVDADTFGKQMPELRSIAAKYQETGAALTGHYSSIVEPYEGSEKVNFGIQEGRYFEPGETGITPASGKGSEKGRLVGGTPERELPTDIYRLEYHTNPDAKGNITVYPKGVSFDPQTGEPIVSEVSYHNLNTTHLATNEPLYKIQGRLDTAPGMIATQPMRVKRVLTNEPVGKIVKQGKKGPWQVDVHVATDEIVNAPLQIQDLEGNSVSYNGQIKKEDLQKLDDRARNEFGAVKNQNLTDLERLRQHGHFSNEETNEVRMLVNLSSNDELLDIHPLAQKAKESGILLGLGDEYTHRNNIVKQLLATEVGIKLPVLDSDTSYEFMQQAVGRPRNPTAKRRLVTVNNSTGVIYPVKQGELEYAQSLLDEEGNLLMPKHFGKVKQKDTTIFRGSTGQPVQDATQSAKDRSGRPTGERVGYADEDFIDVEGVYGDEAVGNFGSVELGRSRTPEEMRRYTSPANKAYSTGGPMVGPIPHMEAVSRTTGQWVSKGSSPSLNDVFFVPRLTYTETSRTPRTPRYGGSLERAIASADPQNIGADLASTRQQMGQVQKLKLGLVPRSEAEGGVSVVQQQPFDRRMDAPGIESSYNIDSVMQQLQSQAARRSAKRGRR